MATPPETDVQSRPVDEAQQRIRIGLTGLAVVFLLVLLGTAISRSTEPEVAPAPVAKADGKPNEPLAEIGAAPSQANENTTKK